LLNSRRDKLAKAEDLVLFSGLPKQKLLDLILMQVRNVFRVDGLYFLGIEEKFGTAAAIRIDEQCWKTMAAIEARDVRKLLDKTQFTIPDIMNALRFTCWSLDHKDKEIETSQKRGIFRVTHCRTQLTRRRKGLSEFPCKTVRYEYLKTFASELNPNIDVICNVCPPDKHPEELWCEWEFRLREQA
jgi:hypothetical protein